MASLPLTVFLVIVGIALSGRDYASARALVGNPLISAGLLATAAAFTWHMKLGMQVVIEDYVHGRLAKPLLLIANGLFCSLAFIIAAVAVLKIATGA